MNARFSSVDPGASAWEIDRGCRSGRPLPVPILLVQGSWTGNFPHRINRPGEHVHIPTHILSGWCVGNCVSIGPRERLFCMIAAAAADIDGLGILLGEEMYWRFHHSLGHNVFYGSLLGGAMAVWSTRPLLCFGLYVALFHLHLVLDFFGSGPGWQIHYLWPLVMRGWKTELAWPLSAWPNYLAFAILLAWTVAIARRHHRTPLELIAPRLDSKLTARR